MLSRGKIEGACRITIGVDPGQSGAFALLADGEPVRVFDMPISSRKAGGHEVNPAAIVIELRAALAHYPGSHIFAVMEQVAARPGQGVSSMFRFGESYGIVKGVLAAMGIGYRSVTPGVWKRHCCLTGSNKDTARTQTIQQFPAAAEWLQRKRDIGRADAILIARWAWETEGHL